jgi:hypothetical protein
LAAEVDVMLVAVVVEPELEQAATRGTTTTRVSATVTVRE